VEVVHGETPQNVNNYLLIERCASETSKGAPGVFGVIHFNPDAADQREHHLLVSLQGFDGCSFIFTHQPAVACYIGAEDSGQLTFEILRVHGITSQKKKPPEGNRTPLEASLSNPSGGVLSWPSPKGYGYAGRLNWMGIRKG
jgi:hypothetical protein